MSEEEYDFDKFTSDSSDDCPKYADGMKDVIAEIRADKKRHIQELKEIIELNPEAMLADGLDDALAGFDTQGRAVYFANEIIGILMQRDGMTEEEATEFFEFNIACAYVGEYTPIYMYEE
jgi:hypothetical protein